MQNTIAVSVSVRCLHERFQPPEGTLLWSKYIKEEAENSEGLNEAHVDAQIAQIQLARSITRVSPAASVRYAIESLAGTGFTRHVQFLAQVTPICR